MCNMILRLTLVATVFTAALIYHNNTAAASSRNSIMARCNNLARQENPDTGGNGVSRNRYFTYRACMAKAGQRP